MHRQEWHLTGEEGQPGERNSQVDSQGAGVDGGDADLLALAFACSPLARSLYLFEQVAVGAAVYRIEQVEPRAPEIPGGQRLAITPQEVWPQLEGPPQAIGADLPRLRLARQRLGASRIEDGEPLEE